jgi:hypothetical protein
MAELSPEMCTARAPGGGQPRKLLVAALFLNDDIQRPFRVIGIDLDIAREQQPGARYRLPPVYSSRGVALLFKSAMPSLIAALQRRFESVTPQGRASGWTSGWVMTSP